TFLRIYRSLDQYRGEAEWSFVKTTATRVVLGRLRSQRTFKRSGSVTAIDAEVANLSTVAPGGAGSQEEDLEASEMRVRLHAAINELRPTLRAVLLLWMNGISYDA